MRKCLFELFQVLSKAFLSHAGSKGVTKAVLRTLCYAFKLQGLLTKGTPVKAKCWS